jgi:hypothetical protein
MWINNMSYLRGKIFDFKKFKKTLILHDLSD